MIKEITYFKGPIVETGVVIDIANFKHPFGNVLDAAVSDKASSTATPTVTTAAMATPKVSTVSSMSSTSASGPNTSLRTHMSLAQQNKMIQSMSHAEYTEFIRADAKAMDERRAGAIQIPLGRGELVELMNEIEIAVANGENYMNALQKQIEKHTNPSYGVKFPGSGTVDFLWYCPYTGRVKDASPRLGMNQSCFEFMCAAGDDVWDLAYDLQKFIQLLVFGNYEEYGLNEDEVEAALAEIKASQSQKNFARFIDFPSDYRCDCCKFDEEEEEPDEPPDPVDGFIAAIGERQRQEAENIEELKRIRERMIFHN